ncbi:hypothetical protein PGO_131270 [Plasmodium gonderi]|uniref:Uncharacterized protein n=1 Tax=Plasmodium gonderi TaxID=77519 RepID=A0A1Y1JN32_PLAGO|nr:hypothetical protein PGO_131270 [Plasmodium gonderi]GAW82855.1 hypothetical protein PGO_131270 [Plasmodium gonderi]
MKILLYINLLFISMLSYAIENEFKNEISVIHKSVIKKVPLKTWVDLVNDSISLIKQENNLMNKSLHENDLIIWNNGKLMNEMYFNSENFRTGNKNVYSMETDCFTMKNFYNTISNQTRKYTSEWKSMKEILQLLMKSKELRDLFIGLKTEEHIEAVRQKILDLTQKNKNYQIFFDILKEHKIVYNILENKEKWLVFVKQNLQNFNKLLQLYYPNVKIDDL